MMRACFAANCSAWLVDVVIFLLYFLFHVHESCPSSDISPASLPLSVPGHDPAPTRGRKRAWAETVPRAQEVRQRELLDLQRQQTESFADQMQNVTRMVLRRKRLLEHGEGSSKEDLWDAEAGEGEKREMSMDRNESSTVPSVREVHGSEGRGLEVLDSDEVLMQDNSAQERKKQRIQKRRRRKKNKSHSDGQTTELSTVPPQSKFGPAQTKNKTKGRDDASDEEMLGTGVALMLPEWLLSAPTNLREDWLVIPRPQGIRCLAIAHGGSTIVISRSSRLLQNAFPSLLPGGSYRPNHRKDGYTLLDCVLCDDASEEERRGGRDGEGRGGEERASEEEQHERSGKKKKKGGRCLYVLDGVCWRSYSLYECSAEFRRFWIADKIKEVEGLGRRSRLNPIPFKLAPSFDCNPRGLDQAYSFPGYTTDGLLLYAREGHYRPALSPLMLLWKDRVCSQLFAAQFPGPLPNLPAISETAENESAKREFGALLYVDERCSDDIYGFRIYGCRAMCTCAALKGLNADNNAGAQELQVLTADTPSLRLGELLPSTLAAASRRSLAVFSFLSLDEERGTVEGLRLLQAKRNGIADSWSKMVFQYRAARGLGEVTWSDLRSAQEIEPSFRVSEEEEQAVPGEEEGSASGKAAGREGKRRGEGVGGSLASGLLQALVEGAQSENESLERR